MYEISDNPVNKKLIWEVFKLKTINLNLFNR